MQKFIAAAAVMLAVANPAWAETKIPATALEVSLSFAPVVRQSAPSVVNIYAKRIVEARVNPFANDPFFSEFFKNFGNPAPRVQNSLGSGVILSADGLIVSNFHVVGGATDIRVVLNDRREFDAEVLLADEQSDLAVLRIAGVDDLPAIVLRPSGEVAVGDLVLAIGNPFGVGQTVSSGIISGLARSGGAVGNARAYFVQTDAPINPGNSGGALVDMTGALVGINTSILTRSGGSNGIGFAIPSDLVASFLRQARAGASVFKRPWAGIVGQIVDAAIAESLELDRPEGMVVVEMHADSPFAAAGIVPGEVITSLNGNPVNGPAEMLYRMSVLGVGGTAEIRVLRDGHPKLLAVGMIPAPEIPARATATITTRGPFKGLTLSQINPAVIAESGLPLSANGVVVTGAEGVAARVGFRPGDILRRVNAHEIHKVADALKAAATRPGRWNLTIERGGKSLVIRLNG